MSINPEVWWAAGFFDGEGTAGVYQVKTGKNKGLFNLRMTVPQNEKAPLERFQKAVGGGTIYGPYKHKVNSNPAYRWEVNLREELVRIAHLLLGLVCDPKKTQLLKLIEHDLQFPKRWGVA